MAARASSWGPLRRGTAGKKKTHLSGTRARRVAFKWFVGPCDEQFELRTSPVVPSENYLFLKSIHRDALRTSCWSVTTGGWPSTVHIRDVYKPNKQKLSGFGSSLGLGGFSYVHSTHTDRSSINIKE